MASDPRTPALQQLAADLGLLLSEAQVAALLRFLDLLARWNATHNLTAVRSADGLWTQHLADCLAVIPALDRGLTGVPLPHRLLDVGSGGGLPGVVIAICRPSIQVTCVDAVGKKVAFIRQAAGELGLRNLSATHARVETLPPAQVPLITSRAFASLVDFVALTRRHLADRGVWMAMKGQRPDAEMADLPADVEVFHVEHLDVPGLDAHRCLVWMRVRSPQASNDSPGTLPQLQ